MPSKSELVTEAIARLDTQSVRSQALGLDAPTLHGLCLRLVDRDITVKQAHRWLNTELSAPEDGSADLVDDNVVYRFAHNFRPIYEQVRVEHARRIARLTAEHATAGNVETMHRVAVSRMTELVTERLVEADNIEDLSSLELGAMLRTIEGQSMAQFKAQELALKAAEGERKAAKLEADLAKLNLEIEERRRKVEKAAAEAKAKVERTAAAGDGKVTATEVYELIDKVMRGEL